MAATKEPIIEEDVPKQDTSLILMPTMNIQLAKQRLSEFQEFVRGYLVEGEDFGKIPGTPKATLYKSGADKLGEIYGLSDSYVILSKIEDWEKGLFDYTVECQLTSRRSGQFVCAGLGCCSSWESKYRWRESKRKCPTCGKEAIIKGKEEYGGGWVCFKKKNGCGAKFKDNDPAILGQDQGRVENPDIIDQKNTILKMAKKRSKIDAMLSATRSSGIFTQDMEDLPSDGPRTPQEANEYDTAGYDRDEYVERKTEELKNTSKAPKQEAPKSVPTNQTKSDPTYEWRMRIANCSTVADFNGLFPDAAKAPREVKAWILIKAESCGYEYDKNRFCFFDPKAQLNQQLEASLAEEESQETPDRQATPPSTLQNSAGSAPGQEGRFKPITKTQLANIQKARRDTGIIDKYYYEVLGRYGAEHANELQRGNFELVLQEILDLKRM